MDILEDVDILEERSKLEDEICVLIYACVFSVRQFYTRGSVHAWISDPLMLSCKGKTRFFRL